MKGNGGTQQRRWRVPGFVARLLVLCLAGAGAGASPAAAGVYEVHACDAAGGANNSWIANVTHGGMASYSACPSGGDPNRGIVTRNAIQAGGSVPAGAGAQAFFHAPPGTAIIGVTAAYWFHRSHGGYMVGLSNGHQQLRGCATGPGSCDMRSAGDFIPVPNSPTIYIETLCTQGCPADSTGDPAHGYLQGRAILYSATVRLVDSEGPQIAAPRGSLFAGGWRRSTQTAAFDASDNTGIRATRIFIGDKELSSRGKACDYTRTSPCPQSGDEHTIDTTSIRPDRTHRARIEVEDASGNVASLARDVLIDNTAPDAPQELTVAGGQGWRSSNDFDLTWKLPGRGGGAPIAGVGYELCPMPTGKCQGGSKDGKELTALSDFKVPEPGEYTLKLWLRDEAGNEDSRLSAPPVHLRYDDVSPELAFEELSADDPTLLSVRTADRGGGVAAGQVEMRRRGRDKWTAMPTSVDGGRLLARIDDERLGDGMFDLRARAIDHAGNERSTDRRADGSLAEVRLPLRLKTRLRAGIVLRKGSRARLARRAYVPHGRLVRVRGRLADPQGNPMQDLEVQAFSQIRDRSRPPRLIATVKTSNTGRFTFLVRRGPSRTLRIRYNGAPHVRSATRVVVLNVRSRTSMRPNRRSLVTGETVRFRGRIRSGRVPDRGKLVELQVRVRGKWRTFATTRAGQSGRWRYDYRFDGTQGRVTYKFRAKVPPEAGYPFATGTSRTVRVRVRGL